MQDLLGKVQVFYVLRHVDDPDDPVHWDVFQVKFQVEFRAFSEVFTTLRASVNVATTNVPGRELYFTASIWLYLFLIETQCG